MHLLVFMYDMSSQLAEVNISNIGGNPWAAEYIYHDNGDMDTRTIQSSQTEFTYTGNLIKGTSDG